MTSENITIPVQRKDSRKCLIEECTGLSVVSRLFSFPSDSERSKQWITALGLKLDFDISNKYICDDHFDKKYLTAKYLPINAVPFRMKPIRNGGKVGENTNKTKVKNVLPVFDYGWLSRIFTVNSGIRQGDVLSLKSHHVGVHLS